VIEQIFYKRKSCNTFALAIEKASLPTHRVREAVDPLGSERFLEVTLRYW